jgi:hypothetical protein
MLSRRQGPALTVENGHYRSEIFIGGEKQVTEPADTERSYKYEPRLQGGRAKEVAVTATARVVSAQKHATAPSRGPPSSPEVTTPGGGYIE